MMPFIPKQRSEILYLVHVWNSWRLDLGGYVPRWVLAPTTPNNRSRTFLSLRTAGANSDLLVSDGEG